MHALAMGTAPLLAAILSPTCALCAGPGAASIGTADEPARDEPTAEDLWIVRRARELVREESRWDGRCDRSITDGGPHSLYAALHTACTEALGEVPQRRFALEEVRRCIDDVAPGESFGHRLADFNNTRTHGEVRAVLLLAQERIEEQLYFAAGGSDGQPAFHAIRRNAQIELKLRELARTLPRWFRYRTIGTSFEGREIPCLHVSDHACEGDKVGVWIDAGIHGFEVSSAEVVVGLATDLGEQVLAGHPPPWLERIELFLLPVLNVDARSLSMRPPYPDVRTNLRPVDDDGDGTVDEESYLDLNGDGRISWLSMSGQPFTREATDADGDGRYGEDLPGGVDLNRDFPVSSRERPAGWGPQPETQAVVDFFRAHPGIELAISYHSSRNMLIAPYRAMPAEESARYEQLGDHFLSHFPGVFWLPFEHPEEYGVAQPFTGMSIEWFHEEGAIAFILEIGPDEGPRARTHVPEQTRLPDRTWGTTWRIEEGYCRQVETLLEAQLDSLRQRHAAYLQEVIERLDRGELR